jgi:hypothetical protein
MSNDVYVRDKDGYLIRKDGHYKIGNLVCWFNPRIEAELPLHSERCTCTDCSYAKGDIC